MVPERALRAHLIQIDVALQHNLRVGRHFQVVRLARRHLHGLAPQEAGKHHLVEVRRNRQHPCQRRRRIGADHHANGNSAFGILRPRPPKMFRPMLLCLPVHPRCPLVVHLQAVHPDISLASLPLPRKHQRKRYKPSAILRPAFQNGKIKKVDVASLPNHFLARAGIHALRKKRPEFRELRQHLDLVEEPLRRFHFQESLDALRDFVQLIHFKRQRHPPHAPKRVDQQRMPRPLRLFEQQRRVAPERDSHSYLSALSFPSALFAPHDPLHHFGNLQNRVHLRANPLQLPFLLQLPHKLPQVSVRHRFLL